MGHKQSQSAKLSREMAHAAVGTVEPQPSYNISVRRHIEYNALHALFFRVWPCVVPKTHTPSAQARLMNKKHHVKWVPLPGQWALIAASTYDGLPKR